MHRDRQVQRSRLLQTSAVMSNDELQDPPGRPTATTSAQPNTLRKVNFGGPGDPGGLDGQGTDSHDYARDSSALAEEGRRGQSKEEGHTGQNMVVKPGTEGAALVNDDGTDLSECAKLPKQLLTQMTVLAGVLKTGETGDKRQRQRPRQQNQQREQAFLTGVPPPHVGSDGPEVPPGTPMSNISTTIARLHDLENSPSRAPASAGSGGGCDADSAERRAIAGLPRSTEKATGVLAGFGSNPPHDMTHASSLGNPSTNGSADVSPGQGQSEDRSAAARTPLWADGSHPSRASCPHDGGSNYREDYRTWRMGSGSRSSAAAAASDQEESGASSVFVRGEIGIDGGMQRVEGRRVEGIVMSALGPTTTTAISSNTECAGNTNKETDKDSSLLGFLRSFVSSHVDSFKVMSSCRDGRNGSRQEKAFRVHAPNCPQRRAYQRRSWSQARPLLRHAGPTGVSGDGSLFQSFDRQDGDRSQLYSSHTSTTQGSPTHAVCHKNKETISFFINCSRAQQRGTKSKVARRGQLSSTSF